MYLEHFRLRELPFTITPDTGFFMNRAGYQDALNVMLVALRSGEGFVKVTGEVGVGKTLLCRKLLKSLGDRFVTAYIHNPYLQPNMLLFAIAPFHSADEMHDRNSSASTADCMSGAPPAQRDGVPARLSSNID